MKLVLIQSETAMAHRFCGREHMGEVAVIDPEGDDLHAGLEHFRVNGFAPQETAPPPTEPPPDPGWVAFEQMVIGLAGAE